MAGNWDQSPCVKSPGVRCEFYPDCRCGDESRARMQALNAKFQGRSRREDDNELMPRMDENI
jgi:hypothetical protein